MDTRDTAQGHKAIRTTQQAHLREHREFGGGFGREDSLKGAYMNVVWHILNMTNIYPPSFAAKREKCYSQATAGEKIHS
jgi:hypothetical protein